MLLGLLVVACCGLLFGRGIWFMYNHQKTWILMGGLLRRKFFSTPSLGFQFYWHARHDQEPSAPGKVACRLCKPTRRSGSQGEACMRRFSSLAAVAAVAGSKDRGEVRRTIRGDPEHGLCFRELFAGKSYVNSSVEGCRWSSFGAD